MADLTPTCDPAVFIESRAPGVVTYVLPATGERWRINGECNMCGACWVGAVNAAPDRDCPVRPEIADKHPSCSLSGEYL